MSVSFDFKGKFVLVTGGSRGIGLGIAQGFASAGANVTITGTAADASSYEADLSRFDYRQCVLSDREQRKALLASFDRLDVLVNNAGGSGKAEFDDEGFSEVMEVNMVATADLCYGFKDRLASAQGAIINLSSIGGYLGMRDFPAYCASKHAIAGFTKSIADKWARDGIQINAVAPGFVATQAIDWARSNEAAEKGLLSAIPQRRFGEPEDIAATVMFLASKQASYISGQNIVIDGGYLLR
jgi:3-oxoacyl-[acyl-carrier protein] reductase